MSFAVSKHPHPDLVRIRRYRARVILEAHSRTGLHGRLWRLPDSPQTESPTDVIQVPHAASGAVSVQSRASSWE
jgi:hypothetical protein